MAHVICQPCIGVKDKACVDVCPEEAIYEADATELAEGDRLDMLYINPDECLDCAACAAECPVEAIFPEEDVPDEWKEYIEINKKAFAN